MGGKHLYEQFMEKRRQNNLISYREKKLNQNKDFVITIPLKGGKKIELDEDFIKVIQNEYAIQYLEMLELAPTQANIDNLLDKKPLSQCEISSGWSSNGWLADSIVIHPNKINSKCFDKQRDIIVEALRKQQLKTKSINLRNTTFDKNVSYEDKMEILMNQQFDRDVGKKGKNSEQISADIMSTWLENKCKNPGVSTKPVVEIKAPEATFKEGMDEIKKSFSKTQKNLKISSLIEPLEHQEMNLDHKYWVTRFLYPFALDTTPIKLSEFPVQGSTLESQNNNSKIGGDCGNILATDSFRFPLSHLDHKEEYLQDILNPIMIQQDEIVKDMYKYAREFPVKVIPHTSEFYGIIDIIHNYKRPAQKKQQKVSEAVQDEKEEAAAIMSGKDQKINNLDSRTPVLTEDDIARAKDEITQESTAKMVGLICHLSYWSVFGHLNKLPLDAYHMKQLFISIAQIQQEVESRFSGKKVFVSFIMPMIVLAVRIEVEIIFKNSYKIFFSKEQHERIALKLINDVITQLIDPNLYYSRLSFFESGREAINIKYDKSKKQQNNMSKFFTRSALVQQLVPNPSEGKVRALFGTGNLKQAKSMVNKRSEMQPQQSRMNTEMDEIAEFRPVVINEQNLSKKLEESSNRQKVQSNFLSTSQNNIFQRIREARILESVKTPMSTKNFGNTQKFSFNRRHAESEMTRMELKKGLHEIRQGLATQGAPRRPQIISRIKHKTSLGHSPVVLKYQHEGSSQQQTATQTKFGGSVPRITTPSSPGADGMLDLVNKVKMFQIATKKINTKLVHKGKNPVFNLASEPKKLKYDQ